MVTLSTGRAAGPTLADQAGEQSASTTWDVASSPRGTIMAARKSRTSGARTSGDRPVLGDMLLSQADTPDRDDPPVQLDPPRNFFVIDHGRQAQARRGSSTALVPLRGGGGALTIDHPGAVFGQLGGALEAVSLPKAVSATPKDSEPFRPRW